MNTDPSLRVVCLIVGSSWLAACAHGSELDALGLDTEQPGAGGAASGGTDAGLPALGGVSAGGGGFVPGPGGTGGAAGSAGAGLTSGMFESSGGAPGSGGQAAVCGAAGSPGCDWSRVDGCCGQHACERASGADVFDTYPVESCRALVECVQAHPGCSTAADPLCFQNESPDAPCLMQGYQASHTDPDGPFAWTARLVACVCGY